MAPRVDSSSTCVSLAGISGYHLCQRGGRAPVSYSGGPVFFGDGMAFNRSIRWTMASWKNSNHSAQAG